MPTRATSIFIFFLLILTHDGAQSASTTPTLNPSRRILHQPFFPVEPSPPPSSDSPSVPPPSPPVPKYPFSGSTPDQTPFFPDDAASPPPPAALSASPFASFPANISLIIPHSSSSKPISKKLIAVTAALSASAFVVASIALFFYFRGRRKESRSSGDDKASRSENSHGFGRESTNVVPPPQPPRKQRPASNNSSEFLYLGTLVSSRGADDTSGHGGGRGARRAVMDSPPRKLDSPELHPLPPLARQTAAALRQSSGLNNAELVSRGTTAAEEEEEEFFSPRGSASGRESSGSGSRTGFVAAQVEKLIKSNNSSSGSTTSSKSSSTTISPARSASVSISPPVSTSPKSSKQKSPEFIDMPSPLAAPTSPPLPPLSFPHSPPADPSPEISLQKIKEEEEEQEDSPLLSNCSTSSRIPSPVESPRLSTLSALNGKDFTAEAVEWSALDRDLRSPASSPAQSNASSSSRKSSSSLRLPAFLRGRNKDSPESTRMSSSPVSPHSNESPLSSRASSSIQSPRFSYSSSRISLKESPEQSRRSDVLARNVRSYPASPSLGNDSGRRLRSTPTSPSCRSQSSNKQSPARNDNVRAPPHPPPPPPPPPPPQPPLMRHSDSPVSPWPTSKPVPVTTPPSKQMESERQAKEVYPNGETAEGSEEATPKLKLKPLHWDKVRASSDREMVWDHLRSSSFKLNEEMIETLFVVNTPSMNQKETTRKCVLPLPKQENRVLDPKKAQNIAILLRALHVTMEEVCEALLEGNAETLGTELLESLLKMAPTKEEERKLKEYKDDSPVKLGPAEKFLKAVIDVPFAFKRVEVMLYVNNFESEVEYLKKSFEALEVACDELRNSRMFLKLLEAVLKTGNRMNVGTNRGDAHAFKLDTLLKLVDVKGADGKTTLLHFVVQEIIRTEGSRVASTSQSPKSALNDDAKCRKLGLQVVSALSSELANVKKAAAMDSDVLSNDVSKLSQGLANIREVVRLNEAMGLQESSKKFSESMNRFMKMAEEEIIRVQAQESVALSLVKEITEYFHGNSAKEEAHPFRIFMVVRDFLTILDRVCKEVGMINERTIISSAHKFPIPVNPMLPVPVNPTVPQAFTGFDSRKQSGSSDDGSSLEH